jgi:hypothetical protein
MIGEEAEIDLSPRIRRLIEDMRAEWAELDRRIAAFDARPASGCDLSRHQSKPGRQISAACERRSSANRREQRRRIQHANARNCRQASGFFILLGV